MVSSTCTLVCLAVFAYNLFESVTAFYSYEMNVSKECFELPVFYDCFDMGTDDTCEQGRYLYDLNSRKRHAEVHLSCSHSNLNVHIIYAEYALPMTTENYCLGLNNTCSKTVPCQCCTEPTRVSDMCYKKAWIDSTLIKRCSRGAECKLKFTETEFSKRDCPRMKYDCHFGGMQDSWCYGRWIHVYYDCIETIQDMTSAETTKMPLTTTFNKLPTIYIGQPPVSTPKILADNISIPVIKYKAKKAGTQRRMALEDIDQVTGIINKADELNPEDAAKRAQYTVLRSDWAFGLSFIITLVCICTLVGCITMMVVFVRENKSSTNYRLEYGSDRRSTTKSYSKSTIPSDATSYQKVTIV